jgi:hypothetical protein
MVFHYLLKFCRDFIYSGFLILDNFESFYFFFKNYPIFQKIYMGKKLLFIDKKAFI